MKLPDTFRSPPPDEEGEAYIGYVRVSTYKEEKISPELQREAILAWAKKTRRRIVKWVEDLDVSGRHFKRKITKCVEDVEAGTVQGVAVWKYSRFGRDRTGNALWLARLEEVGGQLESATEPVDATTAIGRFQRGMILEFAAFESDRAGEQWRETHNYRKYTLGLPAQGRARFGYVWHRRFDAATGVLQKERYEPDPETGPLVASLYHLYVAGTGFATLVIKLNEGGHQTIQGARWTNETLTRHMDSGFAAGLLRVHNPECRCRNTGGSCRNKIYIQGAHEELIDWDIWEAYQRRRAVVRASHPRARNSLYTLTGLPSCGGCRWGASVTNTSYGGEYRRAFAYRCGLRAKAGATACDGVFIVRTKVEHAVEEWLMDKAARGIDMAPSTGPGPTLTPIDDQAARARARVSAQADVDRHRAALARLRAEHAELPEDWGPGEYEDAVDVIRKKRAEAQSILDNLPDADPAPDRAEAQQLIASTAEAWPALDDRQKNALLRQMIRRVVLTRTGRGTADIEVHPLWEPDPWSKQVSPT
ncbi:recombinase family protein [Streptomyces sp. WAC01280]|uniref:recombinase family protein n=1 Tax=Streptomyces sp. WAC01280 TaxID=2487424 RepID=UPI000F785BE2|nr:recombinase family protein [Streptomyces sp. WAC01280]RSS59542.1 recombinase family protein [Streptomyces sp. WAC01280]